MKKLSSIIALALVLVLCIPSVCFAFDGEDIVIRTDVTCPDLSSADPIQNALHSTIFLESEEGSGYVDGMLLALNNFDWEDVSSYNYYAVSCTWVSGSGTSQTWELQIYAFNSSISPFANSQNYDDSHYPIYVWAQSNTSYFYSYCRFYNNSWSETWISSSSSSITDNTMNGYSSLSIGRYLMDCNFTVVSEREANSLKDSEQSVNAFLTSGSWESCTDLFAGTQGYNLNGDVVDGSGTYPEESNANHMYFKSATLGFCVPKNSTNFTAFGGTYAFARYEVDDWVVEHIADYQIKLEVSSVVGSQHLDGGGTKTLPLDPDGVIEVPFSDLYTVNSSILNQGFVNAVSKERVEGNYCKSYLYSVAPSNAERFVNNNNSLATTNNLSKLWELLDEGVIRYVMTYNQPNLTTGINNAVSSAVQSMSFYNPYVITIKVSLLDKDGNTSGKVAMKFNLVNGNSDTTETDGLQNEDPYDPPEDPEDPQQVPEIPSGNSTTPTVIVTGGTWTGELIGKITQDWQTAEIRQIVSETSVTDNFSSNFSPFAENSWVSVMGDYLGALPTPLTTILLGGTATLSALALYRWFRRG